MIQSAVSMGQPVPLAGTAAHPAGSPSDLTVGSTPLTFSVVINTCDRAQPLRTLLYALNRQTYPHFEVIVVLGPTQDDSEVVVAEFGERVVVVRCPEFNLSMSRNLGIAAAAGDIVAFIDDDAVPSLTWLEQLADIFADPGITSAGGKVYLVHPGHSAIQFRYGAFSLLGDDRDVRSAPDEEIVSDVPAQCWFPRLMGTNMACRRQALIDVGGFDERFAYLFEEPDLAIRLLRKGYRIYQSPEAVVYHAPVSSRNRIVFTSYINWYANMRGILYLSFKNATPVLGLSQTFWRCVRHSLFFLKTVRYKLKHGDISAEAYPGIMRQVLKGIVWGFWYGLVMPRRLLRPPAPTARALRPFQTEASPRYPHVAPRSILPKGVISPMKSEPLRICLLSQLYPPGDVEGVARLTHLMAQGLAELGHEVHVIRRGQSERTAYYDGAYVHDVPASDWRYQAIKAAGYPLVNWCVNYSHAVYDRVTALIVNHRIQVVDSPLWQFEGLVTAVAKAVPVVVRLVTSMRQLVTLEGYASLETTLIGDLEASFLQLSQGLIPLSQAIKDTCAELYGIDFANYPHRVIHAGLKPLPDGVVSPLDGQVRDEPVVLFVGRLERRKGILNLFEAIPDVLARYPKAQFWLAGKDNSQYDGFADQKRMTYAEYFQKAYRSCAGQVRFLGYVNDDELHQLYNRCDLLVAPSLFESFGLVFLEAMNHARPAIGCKVGGPIEIVADGETGLLVPPDAPAALAEAIIQLLADPASRRAMGLAGRQRLLEQFHYMDMARNYAEFYRSLTAG